MPPLPPASTTGSSPEGAGRAVSLDRARWRPARPAPPPTPRRTSRTRACGPPIRTRSGGRCPPWPRRRRENRVRAWSSPASKPSELAIRTRRRELPHPACTWEMASPDARAASSARLSSSRVSPFRARASSDGAVLAATGSIRGRVARRPPSSCPRAPAPGHGRGRLGRPQQTRLAEIGGVGEAGGLPGHHPDPGPPLPTGRELLDPPVVEHGRRGRAVLGEHLGEIAAVPECLGTAPARELGNRSLRPPRCHRPARWPTSAVSRIVPAWRPTPVSQPESNWR